MRWKKQTTARARQLRRNQTNPEELLWNALRDGRMLGLKFRRQHPVGEYFLDFACPAEFLAIELDGAGHEAKAPQDAARTAELASLGWRVLRFGNHEVVLMLQPVLETIARAVDAARGVTPHPNPLPRGGEGAA